MGLTGVDKASKVTGATAGNLAALTADGDLADSGSKASDFAGASATTAALAAKAPLSSPAFTDVPTVPTAPAGTNTNQAASTAFVHNEINLLVGGAGAAYDTLKELQDLIVNDESGVAALTIVVSGKIDKYPDYFIGNLAMSDGAGGLADSGIAASNVLKQGDAATLASLNTVTITATDVGTIQRDGIGTTTADGIVLQNTTAATSTQVQWSPAAHWSGRGWNTLTAASITSDVVAELQTGSGANADAAFGSFVLKYQTAGGGYTNFYSYTPNASTYQHVLTGNTNLTGNLTLGGNNPNLNIGSGALSVNAATTVNGRLLVTTQINTSHLTHFQVTGNSNTSADNDWQTAAFISPSYNSPSRTNSQFTSLLVSPTVASLGTGGVLNILDVGTGAGAAGDVTTHVSLFKVDSAGVTSHTPTATTGTLFSVLAPAGFATGTANRVFRVGNNSFDHITVDGSGKVTIAGIGNNNLVLSVNNGAIQMSRFQVATNGSSIGGGTSTPANGLIIIPSSAWTGQAATSQALGITPTWNITGTPDAGCGIYDIRVNRTETSVAGVGGDNMLLWLGVANTARASITNTGVMALAPTATVGPLFSVNAPGTMGTASADTIADFKYNGTSYFRVSSGNFVQCNEISLAGPITFTGSNVKLTAGANDLYQTGTHFNNEFGVWCRSTSSANRKYGMDAPSGVLDFKVNGVAGRLTLDSSGNATAAGAMTGTSHVCTPLDVLPGSGTPGQIVYCSADDHYYGYTLANGWVQLDN